MKPIFYLVIIFLSFTFFLSTGFVKPVSAVWKFDTNFPSCGSITFSPSTDVQKGNSFTVIANASTPGPSTMQTISISISPLTPGFGSFGTLSCSGAGTQCSRLYTSNLSDQNDMTFLANPENKAGNIAECFGFFKFAYFEPWLKTTGGDVHANR